MHSNCRSGGASNNFCFGPERWGHPGRNRFQACQRIGSVVRRQKARVRSRPKAPLNAFRAVLATGSRLVSPDRRNGHTASLNRHGAPNWLPNFGAGRKRLWDSRASESPSAAEKAPFAAPSRQDGEKATNASGQRLQNLTYVHPSADHDFDHRASSRERVLRVLL